MNGGFLKQNAIGLLAMAVALGVGAYVSMNFKSSRKIAFVDTQRLLTGFKESNKVNKEIEAIDMKWKGDFKAMQDSLKAFMDTMTVKYDKADVKGKKEMQEELELRNQQMNNFERINTKKMQDLSREKLSVVFEKVNAFMKEYGASKGYDVIFGTTQGNIIYGEGTAADITNDVLAKLNQRYE
jgi:outer membrane protein